MTVQFKEIETGKEVEGTGLWLKPESFRGIDEEFVRIHGLDDLHSFDGEGIELTGYEEIDGDTYRLYSLKEGWEVTTPHKGIVL